MSLSKDLISQFVKATKDTTTVKKESTVYGTVVKYNEKTYVKIDGSDLLTPAETLSSVEEGERVSIMIKDHTATITGNYTAPSASSIKVDGMESDLNANTANIKNLVAKNAEIENLVATKASIEDLRAANAEIDTLKADYAEIETLVADKASIGDLAAVNADIKSLKADKADIAHLEANYATIGSLNAVYADVTRLEADKANIKDLEANYATIESLEANYATINQLESNYATIEQLDAANANITNLQTETANINTALIDKANVSDLTATNANITNLQATKADVTDLNAANANINTLTGNLADITTLVNGNLTSDNIQSMVITGDKFTVEDAFIKDAMIDSVNASKINTGVINTNNVSIQSNDGSMILQGNLQQFKDENGNVRIQIGKDTSGNFTFVLYDENGTGQLINQNGIQSSDAIADGLIVDAKVADNANIAGSKLDIDSVVTEVNNGSTNIKGTKIYLDDQNQTLNVAFNNMSTAVSGNTSTLESHTTSINTMNGEISQLISDTTITKQDGTTVSLKDAYNSTVDTVNSHTQTIGSLETNLNKVSTGQNKWLLEMFEKGDGIDAESPITIKDIMGKTLIKAILVEDSVTSNQSQFGNQYLGRATTYVYLDEDYNWETTATSDDGSTIYINGVAIATLGTCTPTAVTVPFKQGWNKITWVYNEGIGGDGWDFNPRLTTLSQVKYMNAYPMTNVDEVGNTLDGDIKTISSKQTALEQNLDGFKQTVSETYATNTSLTNVSNNLQNNYSTTSAMNSAIEQKANEITSSVSQTYATKESLTTVDNKFADYSTTSAMNSAIQQKANEITSSVSETYATKTTVTDLSNNLTNNYSTTSAMNSAIDQKANEIKSTVSETYATKAEFNNLSIGGRNLVKNSNFAKGSSYWGTTHSVSDTILHNGHKSLRISVGGSENCTWSGATQNVLWDIQPNATITISCWYYVEDKSTFDDAFGLELKGKIGELDRVFIGVPTYSNQMENGVWKKIVATGTTDCHWDSLYIYPWVAKNGTVYVTDLKVELGNKATDWTPAPEDIDDSITAVDNKFVNYSTTTQMNSAIDQKANEITSSVSETYATKTSVTDLSNNLQNNYSTTAAMNSVINQKANEITSTVSETYATKNSVTDLSNNLTNNYSTTAAMNSAINQKANEITSTVSETYATKTSVTDLSNNLTNNYSTTSAMNSAINQKANEITSSVSETYATKYEFNNLNVGGRNFVINSGFKGVVPNTQTFPYWNYWGNVLVFEGQGNINYNAINTLYLQNHTTTGGGIYQDISSAKIPKNTQITISYDMSREVNVINSYTVLEFYDTGLNRIDTIEVADAVGHVVRTVTTSNSDYSMMRLVIAHAGSNSVAGGYLVMIGNIKIEKGNKATDWTPAPEDIDNTITVVDNKFINYSTTQQMNTAINQKADSITQSVSNTYATKTALNSANNNITSLTNRMSNAESKLTKDSLTTTIGSYYTTSSDVNGLITSQGYATTSQLTQTTNSLTAKFSESGGYNLLRNGRALNGTNYWANNGGGLNVSSSNPPTVDHKYFYTNLPAGMTYNGWVQLENNTHYIYSAKIFVPTSITGNKLEPLHYWCSSDQTSSKNQATPVRSSHDGQTIPANKWVDVWVEYVTASSGNVWFKPFIYQSISNCIISVTDLMLCKGSIPCPYSPHPSEIYDGITQINKDGIKVYHNSIDSNSYTHMSPTGFYLKNKGTDIFKVDGNGLYIKGNGEFTGKVTANTGSIGGFTISSGKLVGTGGNGVGMSGNGTDWAFWAGSNTGGNAPFHVGHEGNLYATQAYITGTITGSTINAGTINGATINSDSFIGDMLAIDGIISAKSLQVQDIDNAKYPGAVTADFNLYVSTSGNDDSEIENGATFATFDALLDKLPKNLNGHEVRIEMSTNITENVDFKGFFGGKIRLYMKGHTLYGYVVSRMGSARINICSGYIGNATDESNGWGKIHPSKGYAVSAYTTTVASVDQGAIGLYNIDVYGADNYLSGSTTKLGVAGQDWGTAYLNGVSYYGCDIGARANAGGRIHDVLSYNVCKKYGFYATTGGYITLAGSEHSGGKSKNYHEADAGKVIVASGATFASGEASVPGGSAPVVPTTKTITIKSTYGDTYRSSVYNNWKKDGTVRQGDYGYGDCNGCWFFGDAFSDLEGKTISKVTIKITRQSGGSSSAVGLVVKSHGYSGRPSGAPSYRTTAGTLSLATGKSGILTITNSTILNEIKSGAVKGFGIQTTYDSAHYAVCSGSVTVKITYTE